MPSPFFPLFDQPHLIDKRAALTFQQRHNERTGAPRQAGRLHKMMANHSFCWIELAGSGRLSQPASPPIQLTLKLAAAAADSSCESSLK